MATKNQTPETAPEVAPVETPEVPFADAIKAAEDQGFKPSIVATATPGAAPALRVDY